MAVTAGVTLASLALALLLYVDFSWPEGTTAGFAVAGLVYVSARVLFDFGLRIHEQRWRYTGLRDAVDIVTAASGSSVVAVVLLEFVPALPDLPTSVYAIELAFAVHGLGAIRLAYRIMHERLKEDGVVQEASSRRERILVVGAGEAGNLVAREIERYPEFGYRMIGFVDDDPAKLRSRIRGVPVLGTTDDIPEVARAYRIDRLVVAIPSADPEDLRRIVDSCDDLDVEISVLPPAEEVDKGNVRLKQIRSMTVEDLLARSPIRLELSELKEDLEGRSVVVTGAAGSIGSELVRQIARCSPARLVALDQAESDLYLLERDIREAHPELDLVPVVGDILDDQRLEAVFRDHRPDRVYHAAAYKHVPLMEANSVEAVRNNVVGTWRVARVAAEHDVGKFVLISTDKAVRPSSVMGATKRVAEMLVTEVEDLFPRTHFTAVRFGNVLGSQGSVIPVFKRQLADGGPLTVTHRDATRYFMTVSEAVQLVLQASLLSEASGRITMLEMGEPVRILELAKTMLRLAGYAGEEDEHIEFIGLRPGEKLHEELTAPEEETVETGIDKVRLVQSNGDSPGVDFVSWIRSWDAEDRDIDRLTEFAEVLRATCRSEETIEDGLRDAYIADAVRQVAG